MRSFIAGILPVLIFISCEFRSRETKGPVAPRLKIAKYLAIPDTHVSRERIAELIIDNTEGNADASIFKMEGLSHPFYLIQPSPAPSTATPLVISAFSTYTVKIKFAPLSADMLGMYEIEKTDQLVIETNDPDNKVVAVEIKSKAVKGPVNSWYIGPLDDEISIPVVLSENRAVVLTRPPGAPTEPVKRVVVFDDSTQPPVIDGTLTFGGRLIHPPASAGPNRFYLTHQEPGLDGIFDTADDSYKVVQVNISVNPSGGFIFDASRQIEVGRFISRQVGAPVVTAPAIVAILTTAPVKLEFMDFSKTPPNDKYILNLPGICPTNTNRLSWIVPEKIIFACPGTSAVFGDSPPDDDSIYYVDFSPFLTSFSPPDIITLDMKVSQGNPLHPDFSYPVLYLPDAFAINLPDTREVKLFFDITSLFSTSTSSKVYLGGGEINIGSPLWEIAREGARATFLFLSQGNDGAFQTADDIVFKILVDGDNFVEISPISVPLLIDAYLSKPSFHFGQLYFWIRTDDDKLTYISLPPGLPYLKEEVPLVNIANSPSAVPEVLQEKLVVTLTTAPAGGITVIEKFGATAWTFSYPEVPLPDPIVPIFRPVRMGALKFLVASPFDQRLYRIGPLPIP